MTDAEIAARDLIAEMQTELAAAHDREAVWRRSFNDMDAELVALRDELATLRAGAEADASLAQFVGERRAWFDSYRAANAAMVDPQAMSEQPADQPTG